VRTDKGLCSDNFLFSGSDGARYMATAGHCVLGQGELSGENGGEATWKQNGPVARDSTGNRIGTFAYAVLQEPKDFALIRLDPGVPASAAMPYFGGPTGMDNEVDSQPQRLQFFGEGEAISQTAPARTAYALFGMPDPNQVQAQGLISPGDSGGGIETGDGRAVGVVVTFGPNTGSDQQKPSVGDMGITRLAPQVGRAQQMLGTKLSLQTAPLQH
jgi:hypothetical protein